MKTSKTPLVSVVMSVYNGEQYLRKAIDSILNQTYKSFEFIIIDDGSTDNTLKIIESYKDSRIRVVSRENMGLVLSLNEGISMAFGEYVARQDADDISLPHRLQKQVDYMNMNKQTVILGTTFQDINEAGVQGQISPVATNDHDVRVEMYVRCPFAHGSVMLNKQAFLNVGGYRSKIGPVEDYDLWIRLMIAGQGKLNNLRQVLYLYRTNPGSISQKQPKLQETCKEKLRDKLWADSPPKGVGLAEGLSRYIRSSTIYRPTIVALNNEYYRVARKNKRYFMAAEFRVLDYIYRLQETIRDRNHSV